MIERLSSFILFLWWECNTMSNEERIVKQIEDLSTSIIKALEALEKELSEYIEITDSRLQKLEEKVHKFESFVDVSGKGLVKAIEHSKEEEKTSTLDHLSSQPKLEQPAPVTPPITPPTPSVTPSMPSQTITRIEPPTPPKEPEIETKQEVPISKIPPIPTPPSFKTVLEDKSREQITTGEGELSKGEGSIAKDLEDKQKKEDDKDKEDLLSALKTIDSL